MGVVYLGRARDGMRVAIKVVRRELVRQPEFRARFRREAESAMRVPRFCTAEVLDADPDAPEPFLVTEYIDGPTLDEVVKNEGPLRRAELDQLGVSIAAALTGIHGTGVIHRDLKPANVLLSRLGPRVIDFGIASAVDAARLTAEGRTLGTPAYMAPEQVQGHPVAASDVFCWGSVMAFAATGRHPFGRGSLPEVVARIAFEPPDLEGLTGPLREAVEAAMRKDPAARPTPVQLLGMLGVSGNDPLQAVRTRLEIKDTHTRHDPGRTAPPTASSSGTDFRFGPGVPTGQPKDPIPSQVADIWRSGRSPAARRHETRLRTALTAIVIVLIAAMIAWSLLR